MAGPVVLVAQKNYRLLVPIGRCTEISIGRTPVVRQS